MEGGIHGKEGGIHGNGNAKDPPIRSNDDDNPSQSPNHRRTLLPIENSRACR
jgi:hypothetical protein